MNYYTAYLLALLTLAAIYFLHLAREVCAAACSYFQANKDAAVAERWAEEARKAYWEAESEEDEDDEDGTDFWKKA